LDVAEPEDPEEDFFYYEELLETGISKLFMDANYVGTSFSFPTVYADRIIHVIAAEESAADCLCDNLKEFMLHAASTVKRAMGDHPVLDAHNSPVVLNKMLTESMWKFQQRKSKSEIFKSLKEYLASSKKKMAVNK
jgi:hypothetical protein